MSGASADGARRRAVLRAGAWAVPAVAVAAAAPAHAVSAPAGPPPDLTVTYALVGPFVQLQVRLVVAPGSSGRTSLTTGHVLQVWDDAGRTVFSSLVTWPPDWSGTATPRGVLGSPASDGVAGGVFVVTGHATGAVDAIRATLFDPDGTPVVSAGAPVPG